MRKLILFALLVLAISAAVTTFAAERYCTTSLGEAEWFRWNPTPCYYKQAEKPITFRGVAAPNPEMQQLYKELYITLLKLRVELYKLQIAGMI